MPFTLLERLLHRHMTAAGEVDGTAPALEAAATGIPPALLDAAAEAPPPDAQAGRRGRPLGTGREMLADAVAAKLLHAWMQNRHQTLYPLTVNLRSLSPEQGAALARWMAAAVLAASGHERGHARRDGLLDWLTGVGAGPEVLDALRDALLRPEPFDAALRRVSQGGLAAYAYVAALVALDPHEAPVPCFLEFLAARLLLPTEVVRSANRRYRR